MKTVVTYAPRWTQTCWQCGRLHIERAWTRPARSRCCGVKHLEPIHASEAPPRRSVRQPGA